jgi:hypothetical protein
VKHMVLYNGEGRWKASTTTGELIALSPDSTPWPWQPQVRYCLLDTALFMELIRKACAVHGMRRLGLRNLLEVKTMLAERIGAWKKQWQAEGKAEGTAKALISLLVGRFGAVPPRWRKRIRTADLFTLERWFERAIDAPDLRSVFNSSR